MWAAIRNFFRSGRLIKEDHHTIITLIPKTETADRIGTFRPIFLCHFFFHHFYLKSSLCACWLISSPEANQAFIKGRRITDNILIANELVRNFHLSSGAAKTCLKVDLRKAYDSVNRQFIYNKKNQSSLPATYRFHLNLQTRLF